MFSKRPMHLQIRSRMSVYSGTELAEIEIVMLRSFLKYSKNIAKIVQVWSVMIVGDFNVDVSQNHLIAQFHAQLNFFYIENLKMIGFFCMI